MMNKQKSQAVKSNKVGAPQKPVRLPAGSFTVAKAIALNTDKVTGKLKVCALTIRKRIQAAIDGYYWTGSKLRGNLRKVKVPVTHKLGDPIPQPGGKVGRPSYRIVPIGETVKKATKKPVKTAPVVNVTATAPVPVKVETPVVTTPAPAAVPTVQTPQ